MKTMICWWLINRQVWSIHPGHSNYTGTLVNALAWYLKDDPTYDPNDPALGLVHRIDKRYFRTTGCCQEAGSKGHISVCGFSIRRLNANIVPWYGAS